MMGWVTNHKEIVFVRLGKTWSSSRYGKRRTAPFQSSFVIAYLSDSKQPIKPQRHKDTDTPTRDTRDEDQTTPSHGEHESHVCTTCRTSESPPSGPAPDPNHSPPLSPSPSSSQPPPPRATTGPAGPATSSRRRSAAGGGRTGHRPFPTRSGGRRGDGGR